MAAALPFEVMIPWTSIPSWYEKTMKLPMDFQLCASHAALK